MGEEALHGLGASRREGGQTSSPATQALSARNVWTFHEFSQAPQFIAAEIPAKRPTPERPAQGSNPGLLVSKTRHFPPHSATSHGGPARRDRGLSHWQPLTQLTIRKAECSDLLGRMSLPSTPHWNTGDSKSLANHCQFYPLRMLVRQTRGQQHGGLHGYRCPRWVERMPPGNGACPAPQHHGSPSRGSCRGGMPCSHAGGAPGETHRSTKWGAGSTRAGTQAVRLSATPPAPRPEPGMRQKTHEHLISEGGASRAVGTATLQGKKCCPFPGNQQGPVRSRRDALLTSKTA